MKGGTTELGEQARHNHPHLHMPNREQHFFGQPADSRVLSPVAWHEYLWGARTGPSWGSWDIRNGTGLAIEKTPSYFRSPTALTNINNLLPSARLVLLLREPAARSFSHFRMLTAFRHEDASNDAASFHMRTVPEVRARCAHAALPELKPCLQRLHACGEFASDAACGRIAHKVYQDGPRSITHSQGSAASWIERSIYGNSIRRMYSIGWGCDRVAIIVSEKFKAEPTETLRSLWKALGVPHNVEISSDHQGRSPGTKQRGHHTQQVEASHDMSNATREVLESFFRPSVHDVAGLVPALNLKYWWPSYF